MSMITAAQWVPRGVAAQFPKKYDFDEDEFDRIAEIANLQLEDANEDLEEAQGAEDVEDAETPAANGEGNQEEEKKKKKKKDKKNKAKNECVGTYILHPFFKRLFIY